MLSPDVHRRSAPAHTRRVPRDPRSVPDQAESAAAVGPGCGHVGGAARSARRRQVSETHPGCLRAREWGLMRKRNAPRRRHLRAQIRRRECILGVARRGQRSFCERSSGFPTIEPFRYRGLRKPSPQCFPCIDHADVIGKQSEPAGVCRILHREGARVAVRCQARLPTRGYRDIERSQRPIRLGCIRLGRVDPPDGHDGRDPAIPLVC